MSRFDSLGRSAKRSKRATSRIDRPYRKKVKNENNFSSEVE
jgi:hypothetical protein